MVGALTAALLVALGTVGSVGYAHNAISGFTSSVRNVVHVSKHASKAKAVETRRAQNGSGHASRGNSNEKFSSDRSGRDRDFRGHKGRPHKPFEHQYGHRFPICHRGHTLELPLPAFIAHLLHGDRPGPCPPPHHGGGGAHGGGNGGGHGGGHG